MQKAANTLESIRQRDVRNRWILSAPALLTIFFAAIGPLLVVLMFSFMAKGDYGDVKYWQFSPDGWISVLFERDPIEDTIGFADANLSIFWRSIKLSLITTAITLLLGFPTAYFVATRSEESRGIWLFTITISILDQFAHPDLRHSGRHSQRRPYQYHSSETRPDFNTYTNAVHRWRGVAWTDLCLLPVDGSPHLFQS